MRKTILIAWTAALLTWVPMSVVSAADDSDKQEPLQPIAENEAQPVAEYHPGLMYDQGTTSYPNEMGLRRWRRFRYHPHPAYTISRLGRHAEWSHQWNANQAMSRSWHGAYYEPQWGRPLALVVPPTAHFHSRYGWGVGQTTSMPIYHQFGRPYPGAGGQTVGGWGYHPAPQWPSNTNQFGVYPVRAPW